MTEPTEAQTHDAVREDGQVLGALALGRGRDIRIALAILACAAEHVINTAPQPERAELLADWLDAFETDA
jgi:acyl-CoA reductase-like NAD-dependent aldehyde dehydrogenase